MKPLILLVLLLIASTQTGLSQSKNNFTDFPVYGELRTSSLFLSVVLFDQISDHDSTDGDRPGDNGAGHLLPIILVILGFALAFITVFALIERSGAAHRDYTALAMLMLTVLAAFGAWMFFKTGSIAADHDTTDGDRPGESYFGHHQFEVICSIIAFAAALISFIILLLKNIITSWINNHNHTLPIIFASVAVIAEVVALIRIFG
jgi:hypothetical protein